MANTYTHTEANIGPRHDNAQPGKLYGKPLSPRETEVMSHVARGLEDKEIARILGVTYTVIKLHTWHARQKLGLRNRVEMALHFHGIKVEYA